MQLPLCQIVAWKKFLSLSLSVSPHSLSFSLSPSLSLSLSSVWLKCDELTFPLSILSFQIPFTRDLLSYFIGITLVSIVIADKFISLFEVYLFGHHWIFLSLSFASLFLSFVFLVSYYYLTWIIRPFFWYYSTADMLLWRSWQIIGTKTARKFSLTVRLSVEKPKKIRIVLKNYLFDNLFSESTEEDRVSRDHLIESQYLFAFIFSRLIYVHILSFSNSFLLMR